MPYIAQNLRDKIDPEINILAEKIEDDSDLADSKAGVLNYIFTRLIVLTCKVGYTSLCLAMGTLFCTALELYRRLLTPYEDKKIKENGDVY